MKAVYKKDLKSAFTGMIGWVLCAFVVVVVSLYFTAICLQSGYADFSLVLYNTTFIFLVVVPLLTMRSIVEERRQKTDQLLLTSRASIAGIVWGKYLALVTVYAIPLAIVGICPLVMRAYGSVSLARSYAALLAFFLMGAAAIAIGLFMSSLTENQIIAYLATFGALLICYLMNGIKSLFTSGNTLAFIVFCVVLAVVALLVGLACKNVTVGSAVFCGGAVVLVLLFKLRPAWLLTGFNSVLGALALFQPFTDFVGGMFSVTGIVYYLSVAGLFLFLTGQALERRRWN